MTFANRETEAAYQSDPTHLRFIDEAKHLWKKVVERRSPNIELKSLNALNCCILRVNRLSGWIILYAD